jgi:hypothetical protein
MFTVITAIYRMVIVPNADDSRWGFAVFWTVLTAVSWLRIVVARRRLR